MAPLPRSPIAEQIRVKGGRGRGMKENKWKTKGLRWMDVPLVSSFILESQLLSSAKLYHSLDPKVMPSLLDRCKKI